MSVLPKRERVPEYHYASEQSKAIIEAMEDASADVKAALEDVVAQFFIDTATWGLALWEQQLGIETDNALPVDKRRTVVRKKMVASGNTTADMIESLAEAITGYESKVEVNDDYSFSLSFYGPRLELAKIDTTELIEEVDKIKPAHLRFVISAIKWGNLDDLNLTWRELEGFGMTWGELEEAFCVHEKDGTQ